MQTQAYTGSSSRVGRPESDRDAALEWPGDGGRPAARCSIWWRDTPQFEGRQLGFIGEYSAESGAAGTLLLGKACEYLAARGCTLAVGPVDGSTWHRYRFVTESDGQPPFFLEPANPSAWPRQFAEAGFEIAATYCSALVEALDYEAPKARLAEQRLTARGIQLQPLDFSRWDALLGAAYQITTTCFQRGFLYQPLPEAAFRKLYEQVRPFVRPELVLFAVRDERPVGFVFSIPNILEEQRGKPIETVILKTLAVLPKRDHAGLGSLLTQQLHRVARQLGYHRVIHALMHDSNVSLNISAHYGKVFRRYALYSKLL